MKNTKNEITSEKSLYSHLLATAFLFALSSSASADQFYITVALECSTPSSELKISFHPYWNEEGEKAIALASRNIINPRALVSFAQGVDGKYVIRTKSVKKKCNLGKDRYEIDVSPLMAPKFHPEGVCAARIGAVVNIKLKGKRLVNEGVDACTEIGSVTTEILVAADQSIVYKKTPAEVFYAD